MPSGQNLFLAAAVLVSCGAIGYLLLENNLLLNNGNAAPSQPITSKLTLSDIPFDGARAMSYLEQICALGRRVSGTEGMLAQQKLLTDHFQQLGAKVKYQQFRVRHPLDGSPVKMANLIIEWHPERKERILLCAHYDTRPFPDRDPVNPQGEFLGANDGASGVALLMELGHQMAELDGKLGVDFVLFDGEELIFQERGDYFLGSEFFAREYAKNKPPYKYRWGVLLDMVGDADLQIYQEKTSLAWRDTRPLVQQIWKTAAQLGVREFVAKPGHELRDDHLPLHNTGKIPTCDIIDFDYPHWHTTGDAADKCSALSLAKVGWVISTWLKSAVTK